MKIVMILTDHQLDLLIEALGWGENETYDSKVYYEFTELHNKLNDVKEWYMKNEEDSKIHNN